MVSIPKPIPRHAIISDPSLVGNWLSSGTPNSADDLSAYGNDGVATDVKWERVGGSFNGSSSYIDCGNDSSLNMGTGSMTIYVWIKTSTNVANYKMIANKSNSSFNEGYRLFISSTETLGFAVEDSSGNLAREFSSDRYNDGHWHYVVGILDRSEEKGYLFVDGVNQNSSGVDTSSVGTIDTINNFAIGAFDAPDRHFTGQIKDVRIYNEAKTADFVKYNYLLGNPEG